MNPSTHIAVVYIGFLLGNLMHTLMQAYQFVQLSGRFPSYKSWAAKFWIPEVIRTTIQIVTFGIFLQNPVLTAWLVNAAQKYVGDEVKIQLTGLSAIMIGFIADPIFNILCQKLAKKYPDLNGFITANLPAIQSPAGETGPMDAKPDIGKQPTVPPTQTNTSLGGTP